jgi:transposase
MNPMLFVGLDVHKKTVAVCVKTQDGSIVDERTLVARRKVLLDWVDTLAQPWAGAMEATMFSGWIYDLLRPHAAVLKVANPLMLRAIAASKRKNDRVDARKIADALRCDLLPECHMAPQEVRDLRRVLRFRNHLVRHAVRLKNKCAGLLMECGVEYDKQRLHGRRYFEDLLGHLGDVPESLVPMLRFNRTMLEEFDRAQRRLLAELADNALLRERVRRLQTIPGVGQVMALTWALEIDDPHRFSSVRRAISYCGLCSAQRESAGKTRRGPLSKQRNRHLQWTLVETAKLAPRWNPALMAVREQERLRGSKNRASLAVARKLVAYLLAVDKRQTDFETREEVMSPAAA